MGFMSYGEAGAREAFFGMHTEKYFRNLIKSTQNQIVFTIIRLISV